MRAVSYVSNDAAVYETIEWEDWSWNFLSLIFPVVLNTL
jgi:hypothetical protein